MSLFGSGNNAGMNAAWWNSLLQQQAQQQSLAALGQGYGTAAGAVTNAIGYYEPYYDSGTQSLSMLGNALGLNGSEGNAAATSAYQTSPGYDFQLGQGIQALDRSAAARGMLNSGNQTADVLNYSQGLANQDYQQWLSNLGGMSSQGLSAAQGMAGEQNTLAGLATGLGQNQASVYSNTANNIGSGFTQGAMSDAASSAQQKQNTLGGILGGLNLGAKIATAPLGLGALGTTPEALRNYNGQAEWKPFG